MLYNECAKIIYSEVIFMLAGFSEIEFTPKSGMMPGGFLPCYAEGTDGGLFSNVAVFTSGGETVMLISIDILFFSPAYGNMLRERISAGTGIPEKNIFIVGTHIHSGTLVEYLIWSCPPDLETTAHTADLTVKAAIDAYNNRIEAKLGVGTTYDYTHNFCRDFYMADGNVKMNPGYDREDLVKPISSPDNSVNVMRVDDMDGNIKCFIVNYANHPDCADYEHGKRDRYSADYPGYLRRALKRIYGEDVIVLFLTGTAGDINCIDYMYGTTKRYKEQKINSAKEIGEALAKDVEELNPRIFSIFTDPVIQSKSEMHVTTRRKKTPEMVAWAKETIEKSKTEKVSTYDITFANEYIEEDIEEIPDTLELEIHTMQIGPWALVGLPGEIYTEIGKRIKASSPYANTVIAELANGTNGYIPPDHIINSTAYEARFGKYNSRVGIGTADILVNGSLRMLRELNEKDNEIRFVKK